MDTWLKGLLAAACVAIISGIGYYFWQEVSAAREQARSQERIAGARRELFDLADAEPGEKNKVRRFCRSLETHLDTTFKDNELAPGVVSNCRALGYLY